MKNTVIPELLESMAQIDKLGNGDMNFSSDHSVLESSDSIIENNQLYSNVISADSEKKFSGVSEIRDFIHLHMTDRLISQNYSNLVDGECPRYIDRDNKLYGNPARACSTFFVDKSKTDYFTFEMDKGGPDDGEITSCKVYINTDGDDAVYRCHNRIVQVNLILYDGLWKIDQLIFNDQADTYSPVNDEDPG